MVISEISTGSKLEVEIRPLLDVDYKSITKSRYFFDWKLERNNEVFKLTLKDSNDILGLVSFIVLKNDFRVHINLLSVSLENKGAKKKYDGIAGNLLTFVSKVAIRELGNNACVSLKSKTQIIEHYVNTYGMQSAGNVLALFLPEILNLIERFDNE